MKELYEIADDVTANLNGKGLQPTFTAIRIYCPRTKLEEMATTTLQVLVFPARDDISIQSRDSLNEEIMVSVGVLQKIGPAYDPTKTSGNAGIDPLVKLSRAIARLYRCGQNPAGFKVVPGDPAFIKMNFPLAFDGAWLIDQRIFLSVINFTFRQAD